MVAVSAFNHPVNLIVHQVGPAIAAGCPVIVKPARDEAIERATGADFASQAAGFTDRLDETLAAFEGLAGSAVMVNDHTAFRTDWMPFAGLRQSGLGVGGIPHTYRDLSVEKMLVLRR